MNKSLLIGLSLAAAVHVAAQQRAPQNESIRQEDLRADLFFVAGDSMRGRLTDTEENRATADFIRSRFERMGLKPAGPDRSYFQPYNLMVATLGEGNGLDVTAADGGPSGGAARHLRAGQEFYPHRFSASGRASGTVMFAGFGISAPHLQYDDFNANLKGQIVLVLDHDHTQYDRPEKINYVKMEKIARLVHKVSWDIANADARPKPPASRTVDSKEQRLYHENTKHEEHEEDHVLPQRPQSTQ